MLRFGFIDLISAILQSATYAVVVVVPTSVVVAAAIVVPTVAAVVGNISMHMRSPGN